MSSSPIIEKSLANPPHLSETRKSPELNEPDPGSEREEHGHGVEWAELVRIGFCDSWLRPRSGFGFGSRFRTSA